MRAFEEELRELERESRRRWLRTFDGPQGPVQAGDGRRLINVSSNDYLGLAAHPLVGEAFKRAVDTHGAGAGASRLVCGTRRAHEELEAILADFKGTEAAVTFGSGYVAAIGTLTALLRPGDVAILDRLSHACLVDGARASGAMVRTFRHNDLDQLTERLDWATNRVGACGRVLVATESVFSMDGDRAPLREIAGLTKAKGALLLVDEAHSFGLCGRDGRGLADELGVASEVDLQMGTLSKAVGLAGGYVAGSRAAIDLIVNRARPLIYSTAPPPAVAAAATFVIQEIFRRPLGAELRTRLWRLVARLGEPLRAGRATSPAPSPIFPIMLGTEEAALRGASALREAGFLAIAIRPPTVPRGQSRLRLTVTASHTNEQLGALASAVQALDQVADIPPAVHR
ncbi:MAG: aminotransferase class I/II-fold pyridoxal phosphate-dependent enzyme [Verrucomicrobiales bacterium]